MASPVLSRFPGTCQGTGNVYRRHAHRMVPLLAPQRAILKSRSVVVKATVDVASAGTVAHVQSATAPGDILAQVALRDDYDPVIFLFCLNAIFLSVVLNILSFGLERAVEGNIKVPEGGVPEVLSRAKQGLIDYFRMPLQPVLETEELKAAILELKDARKQASLSRGTPAAEQTAQRFLAARKQALAAGLSEDSPLLSAQSLTEQE